MPIVYRRKFSYCTFAGGFKLLNNFRVSPDDDNFWAEYSERDFESVYETAHQEQVYGWEKDKIIRYPFLQQRQITIYKFSI
jgi:hypothetical protein